MPSGIRVETSCGLDVFTPNPVLTINHGPWTIDLSVD